MINKGKFFKLTLMVIGVFLLVTSNLMAQSEKIAFEKLGVKEGLPEEYAISVIQDHEGFIWVNTQNGIVKYDGYDIEVVKLNDEENPDLNIRLTSSMILAEDGKIWVGGTSIHGSLASIDPKTQKVNNFATHIVDSLKISNKDSDILFEDVCNNIWFVNSPNYNSPNGDLCRIDPVTKKNTRFDIKTTGKYSNISLNFNIAESKKDSSVWLVDNGDIHRYDRKSDEFKLVFKKGDIIPGTQVRDTIQDLTPGGKSGLIAMGNAQNLYLWDPLNQQVVESYYFPEQNKTQWIGTAFEDEMGNFWVSSAEHLVKIDRKNKRTIRFKFGEQQLFFKEASDDVRSIIPLISDDQHIWFSIAASSSPFSSFLRYDLSNQKFEWFDGNFNDNRNQISERSPSALMKDRSGVLWLGHRPNLYKQEPNRSEFKQYRHNKKDPRSIPSDTIQFLLEDKNKQLWVGTSNGLALRDSSTGAFSVFKSNPKDDNSLSDDNINFLLEDSNDNIWIATDVGVDLWNKSSKLFTEIIRYPLNQENNSAMFLAESDTGKIWASIRNKGVFVLDKKGNIEAIHLKDSSNIAVNCIFHDSKGQTWFSNANELGGLYRYSHSDAVLLKYRPKDDDPNSIINDRIFFISEDRHQNVWIGSNGGLLKYIPENDNFHLVNDQVNAPCLNGYCFDKHGEIWFTTYVGGGIISVDKEGESVLAYGEEEGFLHNDVLGGVENRSVTDDFGKIWLPTQRGLSAFEPDSKTFTNYTEIDGYGLLGRNVESIKTSNGEIWIGGSNGLFSIDPKALLIKDTIPPEVHITDMKIMDQLYNEPDGEIFDLAVPFSKKIELEYWQKDIGFSFVALHFTHPEGNQYSWMLESYDKNWSEPSFDRQVSYTNLSPGKYVFRVKGSNADGVWNEEGARMEITIAPPWWLTWWAYVIYAFIAGLIGLQIHKTLRERTLRLAREKSQQKELAQAKEIEKAYTDLKATQSQLIHSEKMASLGELTAGIAHEIQNPLNFVNNFSEVNSELIEEMKEELETGNMDEVRAIAKDIDDNEKKIMFHGKRADSIVKGMLQHSRTSNGKKEPTDINALADEYLRLAYHGLRAKDKSFNATMETNFDEGIGNINIVSQDIGRVILNLITNAFYVVDEKKKAGAENYEPTVTVNTKKEGQNVEIKVSDNANGIPEKILKKIFQPFFTTKPSGEGTGLGLSLSYDIVKAHGGEIQVKSKENKGLSDGPSGTEFIIVLPI